MFARKAIFAAACLVLALAAGAADAHAQKRLALLIGNQAYKPGVGALVNPLNDVRVVGDALRAVGFEVLPVAQNAGRAALLRAVHAFAARLKAAGDDAVGFLYYSGHGLASEGENYLVPVDIEEPTAVELRVQGVKQSEVLAILRGVAPNAAHYLVLDACRNTLQGAKGGKGFVRVNAESGVLVAFSTSPDKTASDRGQASGPYAAALAAELVKPGQSDLIMFHNVRVAVVEKTGGEQVPWTEDGIQLRERVMFGGEAKPAVGAVAPPAPAPAAAGQPQIAELLASCVKDQRHPLGAQIIDRLVPIYGSGRLQHRWTRKLEGSEKEETLTAPISSAEAKGGELHLAYDYDGGRLIVVPTIDTKAYRSAPPGAYLQGLWAQSSRIGCISLRVNEASGEAEGRWRNLGDGSPEFQAAIRRDPAAAALKAEPAPAKKSPGLVDQVLGVLPQPKEKPPQTAKAPDAQIVPGFDVLRDVSITGTYVPGAQGSKPVPSVAACADMCRRTGGCGGFRTNPDGANFYCMIFKDVQRRDPYPGIVSGVRR